MTNTNTAIITTAVRQLGISAGAEGRKFHVVYRTGTFSHPVEEFALNSQPTFKALKAQVRESTGRSLPGKSAEWLALWREGYAAGHGVA